MSYEADFEDPNGSTRSLGHAGAIRSAFMIRAAGAIALVLVAARYGPTAPVCPTGTDHCQASPFWSALVTISGVSLLVYAAANSLYAFTLQAGWSKLGNRVGSFAFPISAITVIALGVLVVTRDGLT